MLMSERERIKIDKQKEMRTKEISKMIGEGGLGADHYYTIKKDSSSERDLVDGDEDSETD